MDTRVYVRVNTENPQQIVCVACEQLEYARLSD